jgi:hypothetical protein
MNKLKKLLIILILPTYVNANIFDKMDKETAVTTGIYKLSQSERAALLNWLKSSDKKAEEDSIVQIKQQVRSEIIAENKQNEAFKEEIIRKDKVKNMGFTQTETGSREEIHSTIVNITKKNNGKKIYTLENGQQWRQLDSSSLFIPKSDKTPTITIKPKSMGSWSLYIDGLSRNVKVKRVK